MKRQPEDEIKFKELFKDPIRLFGWIFPYFFIIILLLGIIYINHLSNLSFNEQTIGIQDTTNSKKEIQLKKGGVIPGIDFGIIQAPAPEFIAKGKELFAANCKSCHGDNGMGDGPAGMVLAKKPRNFHAIDGWTNGRDIDQMFKTLQEGIIKNGMAAYEYIPAADKFAIISYIRTFAQFPEITLDQLIQLDATYKYSEGSTVPNQIPVRLAGMKLVEENVFVNEKYLKYQNNVNSSNEDAGDIILKNSGYDFKKIYTSYISMGAEQSLDKYVSLVLADPINSGFKPEVAQLTRNDWQVLYDFIKTAAL
jgi:hypothetical protein